MVQALPVFLAERLVAELRHEQGRFTLRYVVEPGSTPLSQRLAQGEEECRDFVANLLPEGDYRALVCRRLELPVTDDFGLLLALGHDCAGAFTFGATNAERAEYTHLPERTLRGWLADPRTRPSPAEADGLRQAISGAQDKLSLHVAEGEPYLCERGAPTTVIVKPDIVGGHAGLQLTALNELFCMQLARSVGLRAPKSFWLAGAYAVERFDRAHRDSAIVRVHQEDFAQLCGVSPARKYGVGFTACLAVADRYATDAEGTRRELVERLLFNLLIGNGDAHCKNFALLFSGERVQLAPAYDLLCTQVYPSLSDSFVMCVGAARRQSELTAQAWRELSHAARVPLEWVKQRGQELCRAVELALRDLAPQVVARNPALARELYPARRREDFLHQLSDVMLGNCKRIARTFLSRA